MEQGDSSFHEASLGVLQDGSRLHCCQATSLLNLMFGAAAATKDLTSSDPFHGGVVSGLSIPHCGIRGRMRIETPNIMMVGCLD